MYFFLDILLSNTFEVPPVIKKAFPFFGKVVDVIWKGDGGSTGLIDTLSVDQDVKSLSERLGNIEIKSYFSSGQCDSCAKERTEDASVCVSCGKDLGFQGWVVIFDRRITVLSNTDWGVIEKIADYILRCPRTV